MKLVCRNVRKNLCALTLAVTMPAALLAQEAPQKTAAVEAKIFRHAGLDVEGVDQRAEGLPAAASAVAQGRLGRLGINPGTARVDARSGRFSTLMPSEPMIPGRGVGNGLDWADLRLAGTPDETAIENAAWQAFSNYLHTNRADLAIDLSELSEHKVSVHDGGDLVQIHAQRAIDGIPVRGSYVSAVIGQGNLTLLGMHKWGDAAPLTAQKAERLDYAQALDAATAYLSPLDVTREWGKGHLVYLPMSAGPASDLSVGNGYNYRLAWSVKVEVAGDRGSWEVLVDALSGEILANEDQNHYASEARGGVLPVTNDGIVPDGVEQPGWPMPYLDVTTGSGTETTDSGGNLVAGGSLTASLSGPYVRMNDNCGSISLTQVDGLDFGTSGGTDCTTPGFGGAGNTHASRTGFYELNKIIEMARGQLPANSWLQQQLTSNMNINSTCNAYWNGTVNFYRSGGGCANTGEIAGVFDHEWGHGMDANDANPGIASPSGEGIADIYTALRLNDSCIGRNFRTTPCSGFGDPCLTCTGVRDIDYLQRQSGQPHDYTWSNNNCSGSVHCVGSVYSEAVWSLWKRNLQSAPYNYDNNTAHEIVNRLTFLGAGATGTWFSGGPPEGGCSSTNGYLNYLAADDDNGDLNDGTPHMQAIYDAFNDQEIACSSPAVQDSGCAGTPTSAPTVSTSTGNQLVGLTWTAVSGTTEYEIFRTEGVFACDFGKVKIGSTTGTSWNDTGLQNGRDYSYVVIPKGPSDACFGPASACTTAAPVGQPDFSVACSPSSQSIAQGESGSASCTVSSAFGYTGNVSLSCSGNPAGVGCSLTPSSVSLPADGSAGSTLDLTVDLAQATGSFTFDVVGDDGASTRTSSVTVQVIPAGSNGPQTAAYDAGLGAPSCAVAGSECDSAGLLDGRANLGPEPNQPNTLDSCTDGTSGSYHSDESNDRIVVRTLDGANLTEGATVAVDVTVWAWNTGTSDTLDLYYAADASSPSWQLIGSFGAPGGGAQTITAQYTLPAGSQQAIRANFRYTGSQSPCSGGSYDDADDLVFAVAPSAPACTIDAECDDGLYCNGAETCNAGACQAGAAPCDDGVGCTVDSCDEASDSCSAAPSDALCDNGLFCDGTETCDAVLGCQAGTAVVCNDGIGCTVDTCNESIDDCSYAPDDSFCSNGLFCDGAETCDTFLGCQAGPGDPCAAGEVCDENGDLCVGSCSPQGASCAVDSDCCSNKCRGGRNNKSCK